MCFSSESQSIKSMMFSVHWNFSFEVSCYFFVGGVEDFLFPFIWSLCYFDGLYSLSIFIGREGYSLLSSYIEKMVVFMSYYLLMVFIVVYICGEQSLFFLIYFFCACSVHECISYFSCCIIDFLYFGYELKSLFVVHLGGVFYM